MNTPFLLLGAAVLFWGWQTGQWLVAVPCALVFEAASFVRRRWELGPERLGRISDTCVLLGPDGIYYLVGTGTTAPWKCDGIPLYKSADLKTWELVKVVVWRDQFKDTWLLKDRKSVSIWAPELRLSPGLCGARWRTSTWP